MSAVNQVSDQQLFEKVRNVICEMLGADPEEITRKAEIVDDLGADSLDEIELVMAFEEAFDIEIADEDVQKIRTVQDIVDYLRGGTGQRDQGVTP